MELSSIFSLLFALVAKFFSEIQTRSCKWLGYNAAIPEIFIMLSMRD